MIVFPGWPEKQFKQCVRIRKLVALDAKEFWALLWLKCFYLCGCYLTFMSLVGVFEENARLLQWRVFFRQFNAIGPLFCSFVQHHKLELRTSKTYSKRQNLVQNRNIDVQNLEHRNPPFGVFHSDFFCTIRLFFKLFFGFHQRVSPSFVSIFCNAMDVKKSQRVPLLHFSALWHCSKISILNFFENF